MSFAVRSCSCLFGVALVMSSGWAQSGAAPTPPARGQIARADVPANVGYYRMPALRGDLVVFVSEGDLWRVPLAGGRATRVTSHPGEERDPAISPDGRLVAFTATYEGPREVYTMPLEGGLPTRRTWDGVGADFVGWAPDGTLLYGSGAESDRGRARLFRHDLASDRRTLVPLAECADGAILAGNTLIFTRYEFQGSHADRYAGGTAQQLWRFELPPEGERGAEAVPITADYAGTSRRPLVAANGRVVFSSDRSGRMNLWSMDAAGGDLRQHTRHEGADIGSSAIDGDRVVYQLGPDLLVHDLASGVERVLPITLDSDFDQTREAWVVDAAANPSSVAFAPEGDRIAMVVRGRVFVVPVKSGRTVDVDPRSGVRYRDAEFLDRETLIAFSDESGELELVTLRADGTAPPTRLTSDGDTVRRRAVASPDGRRIAHADKRLRLRVFDRETGTDTLIEEHPRGEAVDLAWSPDSRWLAYVVPGENMHQTIKLWSIDGGAPVVVTTDRFESYRPRFSPDGAWLWFLSDRTFRSVVTSPWGARQPEPFFDKPTGIYALALQKGTRFPFQPDDEVAAAKRRAEEEAKKKEKEKEKSGEATKEDAPPAAEAPEKKTIAIELDGLSERLFRVPLPAANVAELLVTDKALYWLAIERSAASGPQAGTLHALAIGNEKPEPKSIASEVRSVQLSADGKKLLLRRGEGWAVADAGLAPIDKPNAVDLGAVALRIEPREEWRQMAIDGWRLLRDHFYDRNMHGVDWRAVLDARLPWVDRVRSREELSNVLEEITSELAALHHFVAGGDLRRGRDRIELGSLGADLARDEAAGGWRVTAIPRFDPDEPDARPPLAAPGVEVGVGDVILAIDGVPTLSVAHPSALLRRKAGRQTLLRVRPVGGEARDVIVLPTSVRGEEELRYRAWELRNRAAVEELGGGDFAYIHLRAMGGDDMGTFARDYYPIYHRKGLVIDVRGNRGGNIDSWILSRLMRRAWMYWNQHAGAAPMWNMQFAFRGPMVVLCDAWTASDGEAFTEGFRRLGLGRVIGTRTWGGEIWLSGSNRLVDGGIAAAGEFGVFDDDGIWLIEGHGVEPDDVVDNLPHASFFGEDAQLQAAIAHLKAELAARPVLPPTAPPGPNKAGPPARP